MKRIIIAFLCLTFNCPLLYGNHSLPPIVEIDPEKPFKNQEVLTVINRLFDGMRKGDSSMVSAVFDKNARMLSIESRNNTPQLREGSLERFLNAVGTPHDKVWDERIWEPVVQTDGNMATVWVNYAFYLGGQFSHCGVNAFQLFKSNSGWKIINLTDTRRTDNCGEP